MNDKKIYFTQIVFYLEDSIKEIFIDYIEEDSEFLSIDFSKVERNYWFCKLILKSRNIKQKFLKKINDFRKNFKLLSLKSCADNNITINEIYFEEFENKDWLAENVQTHSDQFILKILLFMIMITLNYLIQQKNY